MKIRQSIDLIECPRDAMQGIAEYIPAELKAEYINQLLQVGFHTIDFGSFVSPKAIPQMRDTADVLGKLNLSDTKSKLLAIVANLRGANQAIAFEEITYLGYPFSISETFQIRNTNATLDEARETVMEVQELCVAHNKEMVLYLSMGFGNPYGDPWHVELVQKWAEVFSEAKIKIMSLSDTIGIASPESINYLFENLIPAHPDITFGAHLHTQKHNWQEKIEAAYQSGCRRFDSAMKGFGGCPMAKDDLTGNMATENLYYFFDSHDVNLDLDHREFSKAINLSSSVFPE